MAALSITSESLSRFLCSDFHCFIAFGSHSDERMVPVEQQNLLLLTMVILSKAVPGMAETDGPWIVMKLDKREIK